MIGSLNATSELFLKRSLYYVRLKRYGPQEYQDAHMHVKKSGSLRLLVSRYLGASLSPFRQFIFYERLHRLGADSSFVPQV